MRSEHAQDRLHVLFRSLNTREQLSDIEKTRQILLAAGMIRVLDGFEDSLE